MSKGRRALVLVVSALFVLRGVQIIYYFAWDRGYQQGVDDTHEIQKKVREEFGP